MPILKFDTFYGLRKGSLSYNVLQGNGMAGKQWENLNKKHFLRIRFTSPQKH